MATTHASAVERFKTVAAVHPRCFWLDGAGGRDWSGRRSFLGWLDDDDVSLTYHARDRVVRRHQSGGTQQVGTDIFDVLAAELSAGPADAQWFGYFGYAARGDMPAAPSADIPDAIWMRPSVVDVFDHPPAAAPGASPVLPHPIHDVEERAYRDAFAVVQAELRAGNTYEVNLTYRVQVDHDPAPVATYLALRDRNPAPYAGYLQHGVPGASGWLLSSSPERFLKVDRERRAVSRPIKGTTPRGATDADDAWLRAHLGNDPRFHAENLMIVDLLRNDLGMVSRPGTVATPQLMDVESYASVHQLVSTVEGRLRDDVSTLDAVRALFPPGSMTGAPKERTMQVIRQVESSPRGAYAGAFGRVAACGEADLGVIIRSLTTDGGGRWSLGTGGGVTVRSDIDGELAESCIKAARLLDVLWETSNPVAATDRTASRCETDPSSRPRWR